MKSKDNVTSVNCCGCGGCVSRCPMKCIEFKMGKEGFWTVVVQEDHCINCGVCLNLCPMSDRVEPIAPKEAAAYAAAALNNDYYRRSSSGGIFSQAAENILDRGGYIWGCGFNEKLMPSHKEVDSIEKLDELRRSKYVQSYMGNSYEKIKERLEADKELLFTGTPCQVQGLRNFLGREYEKLWLIDIVCHGVPSPGMFAANLKLIGKRRGKSLIGYEFRLKQEKEAKCYIYTYQFDDGTIETGKYYNDVYFNEFYDMTSYNECCYECPFAGGKRPGDITIGDFEWGKKYHPRFKSLREISSILINTNKGGRLFENIKPKLLTEPTKWDYLTEKNFNLLRPTKRPEYRNHIYLDMQRDGYEKWADQYIHSFRHLKKQPYMRPFIKLKIMINKFIRKQ